MFFLSYFQFPSTESDSLQYPGADGTHAVGLLSQAVFSHVVLQQLQPCLVLAAGVGGHEGSPLHHLGVVKVVQDPAQPGHCVGDVGDTLHAVVLSGDTDHTRPPALAENKRKSILNKDDI